MTARKPSKKRSSKATSARRALARTTAKTSDAAAPVGEKRKPGWPRAGPGRPTTYTTKMADAICEWLEGGRTLSQFCRHPNTPTRRTVGSWRKAHPEFQARFARARAMGHDAIAEETLDIADDGSNDWMEREHRGHVLYELNGEHIQRSKLRVDTRLKLLAKWDPKRYGDAVRQEHTGPDGAPLPAMVLNVSFADGAPGQPRAPAAEDP